MGGACPAPPPGERSRLEALHRTFDSSTMRAPRRSSRIKFCSPSSIERHVEHGIRTIPTRSFTHFGASTTAGIPGMSSPVFTRSSRTSLVSLLRMHGSASPNVSASWRSLPGQALSGLPVALVPRRGCQQTLPTLHVRTRNESYLLVEAPMSGERSDSLMSTSVRSPRGSEAIR